MKYYQTWHACGRKDKFSEYSDKFPAEVPGNVQWDYARAKGMDNYTYSDNVKEFCKIEDWEWKYSTSLKYSCAPDEKIFFVAEGIDYTFDIILNGNIIHSQEGMYTKVELDITDTVKNGSVIEVLIHSSPMSSGAGRGTRQDAEQACKPPVTYGWDWNPRLVISGIWKPAYIETRKTDYISSCEPFYTLNEELTEAELHFESVCEKDVLYTVFNPDGNIVYSGVSPYCIIKNIRLWWCNGQGKPELYKWIAKTESDIKTGHIGFRKIRLVHNEGVDNVPGFPKGRYPCPITIELNGRNIFAKGSNWVNPDVFFGRITSEMYNSQTELAKNANMNILRCWGGAGINKPEFYEACDKKGIMVWQEFMLACNNYKGNPHYLEILEQEATSVIKSLRSYPCVVLWCGGNELFNSWSGMDNQSYALRLLNKLCFELDRECPFLMTSPEYGMAHGGYTFRDENTGKDVMQIFIKSNNTAYTEFGVPSLAPIESLKTIIPPDELFPIKDTSAWRFHHGFNAWINDSWVCTKILDYYFGEDNSLEERIYHSNWLQCAGYKAIFEEARRQWGHCSMAINWCFNEPWITAAGNSLLAYPSEPKPAYYAVKDSLRPTLASARVPKFDWNGGEIFTAEIWYLNDSTVSVSDVVRVSVILGKNEFNLLTWETGKIEPNINRLGPAVNLKLPTVTDTDRLLLILESENNCGSQYNLMIHSEKKQVYKKLMNI